MPSSRNPSASSKISSFEVKDPCSAFDTFSEQEIERLAQTDTAFDRPLFQRARRLVMTRLENRLGKTAASGRNGERA